MTKRILYKTVVTILVAVFLLSLYNVVRYYCENMILNAQLEDMRQNISFDDTKLEQIGKSILSDETESFPSLKENLPGMIDFAALSEQNDDICGWLYSPGTTINYPVVSSGDDNYYLRLAFDRTKNRNGTLFLRGINNNDFCDSFNIIYGHNMKNGLMFQPLTHYKKQEYYNEHPCIYLFTPEKNYCIRLFSGLTLDAGDNIYTQASPDTKIFLKYRERSDFISPVTPTDEDRTIALSTCSYTGENTRYVVFGILTEF